MASGIASPPGQPEGPQKQPPEPPPTRYEAFIEERLRRTRRQVKGVDITSGVMTLAAGTLAYLLAAAVVDHWLIAGGLDFWGRILLLFGLVGAGGTYFCFRLLPPLVHRINPVFAAQTIEQSRPTLKNSLINFLLMRNHRQEVAPVVYQALEHRAAADLSGVRIETAVDRARIVRLGSVLLAIVAVFALYVLLSPKSPLLSVERIIWPWSNVPAPTRVTIDEVHPGDAIAFHGDILTVTAEVHGLHADEPVTLYYSTADDENVDQAITLAPIGDGDRYQCTLPPGNVGLQQDVRYHLTAGDCRTPLFKIEVQVAPAILIDKVDYHYPDYTGLKNRSVAGQGDLHAIEGTRVTINATANHDIQRAEIDLDCNGRRSLKMDTAGRTATGEFTLRLDPDDPTKPEHDSYQLLFTDNRGRTNTRPIRYRIDVIRDLPPEVKILSPEQEEVQVPVDGRLSIAVRAEDPDFALRQVRLRAQHEGRELPIPPLLSKVSPEGAFPGEFRATCVFQPARLGLKPGDRVMYWAEAEDNKEPTANRSETDRRVMTIVAPDGAGQQGPQPHRAVRNGQPHHPDDNAVPPERQPKQGPAENVKQSEGAKNGPQADDKHQSDKQDGQQDKPQNNNDQQQRGGQESDGSQSGQDASGQRQDQTNDQASGQPNEPVPSDGTNDADAMAKIDKERQKEQPDKQPSDNQPQQSGQQQGGQQQSG